MPCQAPREKNLFIIDEASLSPLSTLARSTPARITFGDAHLDFIRGQGQPPKKRGLAYFRGLRLASFMINSFFLAGHENRSKSQNPDAEGYSPNIELLHGSSSVDLLSFLGGQPPEPPVKNSVAKCTKRGLARKGGISGRTDGRTAILRQRRGSEM